jgi:hypothetical protein
VRDGAVLKNKHIFPEGAYGLFLICGYKMGSVTHTYILMAVIIITYNHKICSFTHIASYILEELGVGSTTVNESIPAPFSKQTESFHLARGLGRLTASHQWLGLAVI